MHITKTATFQLVIKYYKHHQINADTFKLHILLPDKKQILTLK
jgi:hypothetical protein